jgi:nucleoside-diphosphate-sugar epimerase
MDTFTPTSEFELGARRFAVPVQDNKRPRSIVVTGAGGFIGGRLAELLAAHPGVTDLRALSRRSSGRDIGLKVNLENESALEDALDGCEVLIHCAFDMYDMESNVRIARTIAGVCARKRIRMVQISSAAVYEPMPDGDIDEKQPLRKTDDYRETKARIEEELQRMSRAIGLDVIILQPTIVYGPGGRAWTDSPIRDLLMGSLVLPNNGNGLCNAVYIDDVCQAAIRAVSARVTPGERFLISGPAPVKWREFFGAYDAMIGKRGLRLQSQAEPSPSMPVDPPSPNGPLKAALRRLKAAVYSRLGARGRSQLNMIFRRIKSLLRPNGAFRPTAAQMALYSSLSSVRIDKAKRMLGYAPAFDLPRGMASTQAYVRRTYVREKRQGLRVPQQLL